MSIPREKKVVQEFYRPADVCKYLGIGRTMLHRLEKEDPSFPKKIVLSARCVVWSRRSIEDWVKSKSC